MSGKRQAETPLPADTHKRASIASAPKDEPSGPYDPKRVLACLNTNSYAVLDFLPHGELATAHFDFRAYVAAQPERIPGSTGPDVAGGFGCFGTASSFHHPFVRDLRLRLHNFLRPLFRELAPGRNYESLIDRLMYRHKGVHPTAESVHRDCSRGLWPKDLCFGVMLNLNATEMQYFSLQPGTHLSASAEGSGFMRENDKVVKTEFAHQKQNVVFVEPGQIMVFPQNALHEVRNTGVPYDLMRLCHGIRITDADQSLYPDNRERLDRQDVMRYKGGDLARMIPHLWLVNWRDKWVQFSGNQRWVPGMLYDHIVKSSGEVVPGVVRPIAPSLTELDAKYPAYTEKEIAMFKPQPL
jgi:hypothetical protein